MMDIVQKIVFDTVELKKHSLRYRTSNKDAAVSDVYIKRSALPLVYPKKIVVTIEKA